MSRFRVLIAEDDEVMQNTWRRILEHDYDVVGAFADGQAALDGVQQLRPDLVLLDISMPVLNGFEVALELSKQLPKVKMVFVTAHVESVYADEAFRCGADGYVVKARAAGELPEAARRVLQGGSFRSPLAGDYQPLS